MKEYDIFPDASSSSPGKTQPESLLQHVVARLKGRAFQRGFSRALSRAERGGVPTLVSIAHSNYLDAADFADTLCDFQTLLRLPVERDAIVLTTARCRASRCMVFT